MPQLGADMTAGRLVTWYKQPGDAVQRGDIIAEVDTDKGAIDIEVFTSGVVEKILVQPGEKVPVGTPLAIIRETPGSAEPAAPAAAPAAPPAAGRGTRMRQAIAAAVTRSKREIPHYYLSTLVDLSAALAWLSTANQGQPVAKRMVPTVLFIKAVARAARDFPEFNARWVDGEVVPAPNVHVGVVIALREGGLVAPALHDADRSSVEQLMTSLMDVVERARTESLRGSEVTDATINVTVLGDRDADTVFGVIYPPQVALVGFGRVAQRPWVAGGRVEARPVVTVTLAADHRASDGHRGSQFLAAVAEHLGRPEQL